MNPVVEYMLEHMRDEAVYVLQTMDTLLMRDVTQCFRSHTLLMNQLMYESRGAVGVAYHNAYGTKTYEFDGSSDGRRRTWDTLVARMSTATNDYLAHCEFEAGVRHYCLSLTRIDRYASTRVCSSMSMNAIIESVIDALTSHVWSVPRGIIPAIFHSQQAAEQRIEQWMTVYEASSYRRRSLQDHAVLTDMEGRHEYAYCICINGKHECCCHMHRVLLI